MMQKDTLKRKLYSGSICLGTWMFIPSPDLVEIVGLAGFDFAVVDMEHSSITYQDAIMMMRAAETRNLTPLLRVPKLDSSPVLRALDSGAHGIQFPHIETRQDCVDAIKFVKYFPLGERGVGPTTRGGNYSLKNVDVHMKTANESTLVIVSLESKESIERLPEMLEVEGVDVVYIAPYDLSQTLGIPGEVENPKVVHAMEQAIRKIRDAKKMAGSFAPTATRARELKEIGVQYLTCQADGSLIRDAYEEIKRQIVG